MVIDASVGCAAGGKGSDHPTPINCRDFLLAFRDLGYRLVISSKISEEWKNHSSKFASKWYTSMFARKRYYHIKAKTGIDHLYNRIERTKIKLEYRRRSHAECVSAMRKDYILIEASINTDKRVISLDEEARFCFGKVSSEIKELKKILWVNPDKRKDAAMVWLRGGARNENHLLLGNN